MYKSAIDPYAKSRKAMVDLIEKWSNELINKRLNDPLAVRIAAEMEEVVKTERTMEPPNANRERSEK